MVKLLITLMLVSIVYAQDDVIIIEPDGDIKQCYVDSSGIMVCI